MKPYEIVADLDPADLFNLWNILEETKFKINSHREKNAGIGLTSSHGLVIKRPMKVGEKNELVIANETKKNKQLFLELHKFSEMFGIDYTTIQVNKNYTTKPHRDIANAEDQDSYLFSLGDYVGGELCIEDTNGDIHKINANCRLIKFNGNIHTHYNMTHMGTKYSIVYYKNERVCKEANKIVQNYNNNVEMSTEQLMKYLGFVKSI